MFERGRRKEKVLGELKPKIRKLIVDFYEFCRVVNNV